MRSLNCRDFIELLDDFLIDVLTEEAHEEFTGHMRICPYCVDYLKTYEAAIHMSKYVFAEEDVPPPEVFEKLARSILSVRTKNQYDRA